MINLSKKAASRFNYRWTDLNEQNGDFWKIDTIMVSRYPVVLFIHEYTLFTLVRRKTDFKTIKSVINEIMRCCPWYKHIGDITIGKNTDKKLNGNINEMKRSTAGDYSTNFCLEIESIINNCLFLNLSTEKYGYGTPIEAVEKYVNGHWQIKT